MHGQVTERIDSIMNRAKDSRSTGLTVPSGNRLKIDILVASYGFIGHGAGQH